MSLRHPDNWKAYQQDQSLTLAPDGGIVGNDNSSALAYGVIMKVFAPESDNRSSRSLQDATNQLIESLRRSNTAMRISRDLGKIRVGGKSALSKILTNDSPLGGRETDWLVTVLRPEGLLYFVFAAPEQEFADYQGAFEQILNSVRFSGQ